ncbi:MAG: phenylacetate--CoA ligase family protein [Rhizobiaceae bacterium]
MQRLDSQVLTRLSAMSREEILGLQFAKLKRQLERQYHGNAFYRARFDRAKVDLGRVCDLDGFSAIIPTMGKPDCLADQTANPPFGARVGVSRREVVMVNLTGGTSGQGQEVYGRTNHDVAMQGYLHYLPWYLAGLRQGDLALNCVPAGGLTTGGWGPGEGFRLAGATAFSVGGGMSTDAKIDLMLRFRDFAFIYASTSYLHTLTEALRKRHIDPKVAFPKMRTLFIAAEGYPVDWALRIQEFWGIPVHEGYGSTQGAGFIASTCDAGAVRDGRRGAMHVFDWHNVVEILDPETLRPARAGEEGEIVLTNLDIVGSPVIRFRTGDKVRVVDPADPSCSRRWTAFEAGGMGRIDDMMKIRGNNIWPAAVDQVLFRTKAISEYAGRVYTSDSGRTEVEIRLALGEEAAALADGQLPTLLDGIRGELKQVTNVNMELRIVDRTELPNYDYKTRRWTDERKAGLSAGGKK